MSSATGHPSGFGRPRGGTARQVEAEVRSGVLRCRGCLPGRRLCPDVDPRWHPSSAVRGGNIYSRLATATYDIDPRTWGPTERLGAWRALGLEPGRPEVELLASTEARDVAVSPRRPSRWQRLCRPASLRQQPGPVVAVAPSARVRSPRGDASGARVPRDRHGPGRGRGLPARGRPLSG